MKRDLWRDELRYDFHRFWSAHQDDADLFLTEKQLQHWLALILAGGYHQLTPEMRQQVRDRFHRLAVTGPLDRSYGSLATEAMIAMTSAGHRYTHDLRQAMIGAPPAWPNVRMTMIDPHVHGFEMAYLLAMHEPLRATPSCLKQLMIYAITMNRLAHYYADRRTWWRSESLYERKSAAIVRVLCEFPTQTAIMAHQEGFCVLVIDAKPVLHIPVERLPTGLPRRHQFHQKLTA